MIVNELSRELDAYVRSAHFHKDRRGLLVAGPLWDYDLTFGTGKYFNNDQVAGWQYEQVRDPHANDWFLSLMSDPAFVAAVEDRWRTLRAGLLSDAALQARATELAAPITAAAQRNVERWPVLGRQEVGSFQTEVTETWQEQFELLQRWVVSRAAWLDSPEAWGEPATTTTTTTTDGGGAGRAGCAAEYVTLTTWPGGFQGQVTVTATEHPISAWSVRLRLPEGASAAQVWSTQWQAERNEVTAESLHWNGSVSPGESATFGFIGAVDGELSAESEAVACTGKRTSEFNDLGD